MKRNYQSGQKIRLRSSQGEIERVVVRDLGGILLICRPEEYQRAHEENRAPASIGFKKSDVLT
jgi:hypothetical protein